MIAIILGTRPEIIKMSPVIRACQEAGEDFFILHTGQHYSYGMDRVFFEELALPAPAYNLDVGSGTHASQTGAILAGVERVLSERTPDVVLVQGDTNTVLAGSLAASKIPERRILIGHVEAGLRSFDRRMPEEINRVLTDHLADYLFAPTKDAQRNLRSEGIENGKIFITGNTIVDAVCQNLSLAREKTNVIESLGLEKDHYFLVTLHRQENVDDKARLSRIIEGLVAVREQSGTEMIFPVHPRTAKMIEAFGIETCGIHLIPPLGFLEFLELEAGARLALTDSGGVQEECCILSVPCVTVRDSTERPETVNVGANVVAGYSAEGIISAADTMLAKRRKWKNPFGDGHSGERILTILET